MSPYKRYFPVNKSRNCHVVVNRDLNGVLWCWYVSLIVPVACIIFSFISSSMKIYWSFYYIIKIFWLFFSLNTLLWKRERESSFFISSTLKIYWSFYYIIKNFWLFFSLNALIWKGGGGVSFIPSHPVFRLIRYFLYYFVSHATEIIHPVL